MTPAAIPHPLATGAPGMSRGRQYRLDAIAPGTFRLLVGDPSLIPPVSRLDLPANYEGSSAAERTDSGGYRIEPTAHGAGFSIIDDDGRFVLETGDRWLEAHIDSTVLRFHLAPEETIHGLGQAHLTKLCLRGTERRMWHEVRNGRYPCNTGLPFVLSTGGWALLLNSSSPSRFVIGDAVGAPPPVNDKQARLAPAPWTLGEPTGEEHPDRMSVIIDAPAFEAFILVGANAGELLEKHHRLTGGASMLPAWGLGYIQSRNRYRDVEEIRSVTKQFRALEIPCDVIVIDWYWFEEFGDFDWDPANWSQLESLVSEIEALGFTPMISLHPYVDKASRNWRRFDENGILVKFPESSADVTSHDAILDITHPGAIGVIDEVVRRLHRQGMRAWWLDQTQPEVHPWGAVHHVGSREDVHNVYPLLFLRAVHDAVVGDKNERPFILTYSAWETAARYGAVLWTGDVDPTWEVFRDQIVIGQQLSLSGFPYWTTDQGGYVHYPHYDPELFVRWTQWGAFCPVTRTHSKRPESEPWSFGPSYLEHIRAAIKLRYCFLPHIYQAMIDTYRKGLPIVRPMLLACPTEPAAWEFEHQFFVGDDLLVAPVFEPDRRTQTVFLPHGNWLDWWTGKPHSAGVTESFSPLDRIPLFVRAGAVMVLSDYTRFNAAASLADFSICIYPGAPRTSTLVFDDLTGSGIELDNFGEITIRHDGAGRRIAVSFACTGSYRFPKGGVRFKLMHRRDEAAAWVSSTNDASARRPLTTMWDSVQGALSFTLRPDDNGPSSTVWIGGD